MTPAFTSHAHGGADIAFKNGANHRHQQQGRNRLASIALLAVLAVAASVAVGHFGDHLQSRINRHDSIRLWILVEEGTHGLLGAAVCLPLIWSRRRVLLLAIPLVLATAIDIDHYYSAQARLPELTSDEMPRDTFELLGQGVRSPVHSVTFAAALALAVMILSWRLELAWMALAAVVSHLVRDAHTGPIEFWWPSSLTYPDLSSAAYLCLEAGIALSSAAVAVLTRPANAFLRSRARAALAFLVPQQRPPDWNDGGPVAPVKRSHHQGTSRRKSSRHRASSTRSSSVSGSGEHSARSRSSRHSRRRHHNSRSTRDDGA